MKEKVLFYIKAKGLLHTIKDIGGYENFNTILPDYFTNRENKIQLINEIVSEDEGDGHIFLYEINADDIHIHTEAVDDGHTHEEFITMVGDGSVGVSVYEFDDEGHIYDDQSDNYIIRLGKLQDKFLNKIFELLVDKYLL
jgi:hypothetical protein